MTTAYIPQARMPPAVFSSGAGAAQDAISTSSSTLVNRDLDEDVLLRQQHQQHYRTAKIQPLSDDRSNVFNGMRSTSFTSDGWLKAENTRNASTTLKRSSSSFSSHAKEEYPDDHRCSDQDTASGLCGCNRDASGSSSSPATMSEQEEENKASSTYDQQLLAARKRKLMMEKHSQSSETTMVKEAASRHAIRGNGSQSRDLQSDPVLVPRLASHVPSPSYDDLTDRANFGEEGKGGSQSSPDRRWASSPIPSSTYGMKKSPNHPVKAPPSAARKSISSVFEKLLKEEEQRREEERLKKEAARERRRKSKRRKEEEWPQGVDRSLKNETIQQINKMSPVLISDDKEIVASLSKTSPIAFSSHVRQDSNRLEGLFRRTPSSNSITKIAPRPSPEKPAASLYKAKLSALRSASLDKSIEPLPLYQVEKLQSSSQQTKAKSATSNQSVSDDDSHASQGEQITIGSDFQGQAPLQSTPPRNSPLTLRSQLLVNSPTAKLNTTKASIVEDSLQQTVQQLTAVLHEVRDIKRDTDLSVANEIPLMEIKKAGEQRQLALQTVSEEGRKKITDIDQVYVERLGRIRERLQGAKKKVSVERLEIQTRSFRLRSILLTLFVQLLFAWLMMMAAEMRARQLFLTTYYDPFLPHDIIDLSQGHSGSLFAPLLQTWSIIPDHSSFIIEDNSSHLHQSWTNTISFAASQLVRGPERMKAARLLSIKFFTLLGVNSSEYYHNGSFLPT